MDLEDGRLLPYDGPVINSDWNHSRDLDNEDNEHIYDEPEEND